MSYNHYSTAEYQQGTKDQSPSHILVIPACNPKNNVEIIDVHGDVHMCRDTKNWPPFNFNYASGGFIGGKPLICGRRHCFVLASNEWVYLTSLNVNRLQHRSIALNKNCLWITGGKMAVRIWFEMFPQGK